jgi:hypothetical protein
MLGLNGLVERVLSDANERMERRCQLQARGVLLEMLLEKVTQWLSNPVRKYAAAPR